MPQCTYPRRQRRRPKRQATEGKRQLPRRNKEDPERLTPFVAPSTFISLFRFSPFPSAPRGELANSWRAGPVAAATLRSRRGAVNPLYWLLALVSPAAMAARASGAAHNAPTDRLLLQQRAHVLSRAYNRA